VERASGVVGDCFTPLGARFSSSGSYRQVRQVSSVNGTDWTIVHPIQSVLKAALTTNRKLV